ncbi:MAG: CoA transferase [Chloroflexi bacterium]|nr:CoA transferase [Chloroflexota bacterium]
MLLLKNILVLDFTRVLAGPFCTMTLRDLGARVIKVEQPAVGDEARGIGPFVNGQSVYFASVNGGKESITLDLKKAAGRLLAQGLAAKADVVVENFKPGTMARLGLDYSTLKGLNPRLVYLSLSGFGQSGPYASRGAYDVVIQALGGIMSLTGEENGNPTRVGVSVGDIIPALYAVVGILAALHRREVTGRGAYIDLAMMDALVAVVENALARYSATGEVPRPVGNRHPAITPFALFPSADGYIVVAAGRDDQWQRLCQALGLSHMAHDPRYATNQLRTQNVASLSAALAARLSQETTAHWEAALDVAQVPYARVNNIADLVADPHIRHRNMILEVDQPGIGPMLTPGIPIKILGEEDKAAHPAPTLGGDTDSVLKEVLGLTGEEIAALRAQDVL